MGRKRPHGSWDDADRAKVRVLLECPPTGSPSIVATALEREGYAVRTCEGPGEHRCDLVADGMCSLVDGADVVVNLLGSDAAGREVLRATTEVRRPPAVVASLTDAQAVALVVEANGEIDPRRVTVTDGPLSRRSLVDAIDEAMAAPTRPTPIWGDGFC